MTQANFLKFENVEIQHQRNRKWCKLIEIDTTVEAGQITTIMGPSGVGKSTLLNWTAGLLSNDFKASGILWLNDKNMTDVPTHQRNIGLLFQDALLFPHLSVAGNLAFGMSKQKRGVKNGRKINRKKCIEEALDRVGLSGMGKRDPATLSGGQQARVALLRVLLAQPKAILLDEPFSKLDATLRYDMREWVFSQIREAGLPALMVTHDREDAEHAQGEIIKLN